MKQIKIQYCAEKDMYINPQDCNDTTENCFCDCYPATQYQSKDDVIIGRIVSERTLPDDINDIEPVTYIFITKEHLDSLPELVNEALKADDMSIILKVKDKIND